VTLHAVFRQVRLCVLHADAGERDLAGLVAAGAHHLTPASSVAIRPFMAFLPVPLARVLPERY